MTERTSHYPDFDVLREKPHWDDHTREIVEQRLQTESFAPPRFLTPHEADSLSRLCAIVLDERRGDIVAFVVHHFDAVLHAGIGESQRKIGVPAQSVLMREGLAFLDRASRALHGGRSFCELPDDLQEQMANALMQGHFPMPTEGPAFPVQEFVNKLTSEAVAACYSHPSVWSEIGYAGPAYPRGYVRSELGLTDPWEARSDGR